MPDSNVRIPLDLASTLERVSALFREYFTPDKDFDRTKCAAEFRAQRQRSVQITPGYDAEKFTVAWKQFQSDPTRLTDGDLSELAVVDQDLADRARAARSGSARADVHDDGGMLDRLPVSASMLFKYVGRLRDQLKMSISTNQRLSREVEARVAALEQRLSGSASAGAALPRDEDTIKTLVHRVQWLEARPSLQYLGVHEEGKRYRAGSAVTHNGSLWIAKQDTTAKPGDGETTWQLAVKRGRDGRDMR